MNHIIPDHLGKELNMSLLERMDKHEIRELLGKCWITHDGMWFAHTLSAYGIEEANRLNRAAIKSMAEIELKRFMRILNVSRDDLKAFQDFRKFFTGVQSLLLPDFMNVTIWFEAPAGIRWAFSEKGCFAYKGMKRAGVETDYRCGPLYRIQCWLKNLEIPYAMTPDITTCIMPEKGSCSGRFQCEFR